MAQYLKPDSELGYVEDSAEIAGLKFNNLRHSVLGCMLGDFNEVGDYVVSPEIVKELIAMEKHIVQTYDNIELCKSVLKLDKQISFMVTFEGNKATLSLVEKMNYEANFAINSGTYSNINEYVLDSVETSGEINRNVVYDRWNISPYGGQVVDIFSCDDSVLEKYFGIVNRFKYLLEANKTMLKKEEELEEVESGYSNDIFEILKRYPKLEKAVVETIKQTLTENKEAVSIKKPFFAKTFNEVLENAIEKNLNSLNENEKKEFETEKRNAILNLNIKRENIVEIEHQKDDNSQENEIVPAIVTLKVPSTTKSKTMAEIGEEFVTSHKEVVDRITTQQENATGDKNSEKEKLVSTLVSAGVGALIGGATGALVGAVAGATVSEITDKINANNPTTQQTKKTTVQNTPNKNRRQNNNTTTKAKNTSQQEKGLNERETNSRENTEEKESNARIFARFLAGARVVPTNLVNEDVKGKVVNTSILDMLAQAKTSTVTTEVVNNNMVNEKVDVNPVERKKGSTISVNTSQSAIITNSVSAQTVKQNANATIFAQEIEETHSI